MNAGYTVTSYFSPFKISNIIFVQFRGFANVQHTVGAVIGRVDKSIAPKQAVTVTALGVTTGTDLGVRGETTLEIKPDGTIAIGDFNSFTNFNGVSFFLDASILVYTI